MNESNYKLWVFPWKKIRFKWEIESMEHIGGNLIGYTIEIGVHHIGSGIWLNVLHTQN